MTTNKQIRIFDIDNCLSDDAWRMDLIKWDEPDLHKRFHDYHMEAIHDEPANKDRFFEMDVPVVLVTAAPAEYEERRMAWFAEHFGTRPKIVSRPAWCTWTSPILKGSVTAMLRCNGYDPIAAYDDRRDVCDMYMHVKIPLVEQLLVRPHTDEFLRRIDKTPFTSKTTHVVFQ